MFRQHLPDQKWDARVTLCVWYTQITETAVSRWITLRAPRSASYFAPSMSILMKVNDVSAKSTLMEKHSTGTPSSEIHCAGLARMSKADNPSCGANRAIVKLEFRL